MTAVKKNSNKPTERNLWLDMLKAFAILAVVFYHLGVLPFGYLGVDLFLVINGYLITKSMQRNYAIGQRFSYIPFLISRLSRLWLPVLLAAAVSLGVGFFTMLPDDLENLSYSVVASNCFLNNVLACITTKNYWDVVNNYKPLMHTWYLGVVMQSYVFLPFFFILPRHMAKSEERVKRYTRIGFWAITVLSLLLYLLPCATAAQKFYYLPFRFFEIGFGALAALYLPELKEAKWRNHAWLFAVLLLALFVLPLSVLPATVKLLLSVAAGVGCLFYSGMQPTEHKAALCLRGLLSRLGAMSYSVFIWHQVVFALWRYAVRAVFNPLDYIVVLLLTAVLSLLSYYLLEQRLLKPKGFKAVLAVWVTSAVLFLSTTGVGLWLYRAGGVVRDVPELSIHVSDENRGVHAAYNDRVYKMNIDFQEDSRSKVFVIGNSFGRDWVNVLLESEMAEKLDISYAFSLPDFETYSKRLETADYIFWVGIPTESEAAYIKAHMKPSARFMGIGTKNYGECNGNVYNKRHRPDYFELRETVMPNILEDYQAEKAYWSDAYIDFLAPIMDEKNTVPVFSQSHRFISQDCRHLTQGGAKFYAELFDWETIFTEGVNA